MKPASGILAIAMLATSGATQALFQPLERNHFEPDPGTTTLDKSIDCPKCGLGALMMGKPGERIVNVDTRLKEAS